MKKEEIEVLLYIDSKLMENTKKLWVQLIQGRKTGGNFILTALIHGHYTVITNLYIRSISNCRDPKSVKKEIVDLMRRMEEMTLLAIDRFIDDIERAQSPVKN